MDIFTTIAGLNFRPASAKEVVRNLTIGDGLRLEREPENPYDSNAVRVIEPDSEEFIDYIPKIDNAEIAAHLDKEGKYECVVVSFLGDIKPGLKVTLFEELSAEDASNIADSE